MSDSPVFQWSVFTADRNEQFVVRCDDFHEFEEKVEQIRRKIRMDEPVKEFEPKELPKICDIHKVPMQKKNGKYGEFWSHRWDKGFCNGKK